MADKKTNEGIRADIAKGWTPNSYLTNISVAHFQPDDWFVAPFIFPIVPVQLSTSSYYIFNKGDLARDNVKRKPAYGKVEPMIFGQTTDLYECKVDQVIVGIDSIAATDYRRAGTPGLHDPRRAKVIQATEQLKLHMDRLLAEGFFKADAWTNVFGGKATPSAAADSKEFHYFGDANFNPIDFFGKRKVEMMREGRRKPNVLALGVEAYEGLKQNPIILERVMSGGSTVNPATVNQNVIAQLLEVERVVVLNSTYNTAGYGKTDMQFICDSKGALLCYTESSPSIETPTAGYTFAWDFLANGSYIMFDQWAGESGTHSEFVEGLMSIAPKKVCDELGIYLTDCVAAA